jgi:hypothetical protein
MERITEVNLTVNNGVFQGLAKQNLLFHQCLIELVDNSIAASIEGTEFLIDVQMIQSEDDSEIINLYIGDNGKGMSSEVLKNALQLGQSATTTSRLNEHGFGLKNALATLTSGTRDFDIWTKHKDSSEVHHVSGPFQHTMTITSDKDIDLPSIPHLTNKYSTIIKVSVNRSFIQTVQGRGARSDNLTPLRLWLIEHLGVTNRGYLEVNQETGIPYGNIFVSIGADKKRVPSLSVPLANAFIKRFNIELSGKEYELVYKYGTLDKVEAQRMLYHDKVKFYYQGNQVSQGIDIRLGKRTIATRQFENIWRKQTKNLELLDEPISRHNRFNDFVGELTIPELPRGVLTTINNKTDFNLDDPDWIKIFNKLNEFRPIEDVKEYTVNELIAKLVDRIKALNPLDTISTNTTVWYTGARIDIYQIKSSGEKNIYQIKSGIGSPMDLYQLKMYWDGLLISGIQPDLGTLVVEKFDANLERMAEDINTQYTPMAPRNSLEVKPYNFKVRTHNELGLDR